MRDLDLNLPVRATTSKYYGILSKIYFGSVVVNTTLFMRTLVSDV